MTEYELSDDDLNALHRLKAFLADHPLAVGVGEMAVGAALIYWGFHSGAIELGAHVVGCSVSNVSLGAKAGASVGAMAGLLGSQILGSIGIAAMGTAIGIPTFVLAVGGAGIFAACGYTVGDIADHALSAFDPSVFAVGVSALAVGLYLLIDGARKAWSEINETPTGPSVSERAIHLGALFADVAVSTASDLDAAAKQDPITLFAFSAASGFGAAIAGSSIATGMVSVAGSQTLGAVALSLGLVSAPVWPVIVGGLGGIAIAGILVSKWLKWRSSSNGGAEVG